MSVVDVLGSSSADREAIALVGRRTADPTLRVLTFGDLDEAVSERAAELTDVEPGRAAPRTVRPDLDGVVDLLALWRRGAVPVPLNARSSEAERADAVARLRGIHLPQGSQVVLWTSGTSGRPRGVALSWENLRASVDGSTERLGLASDDVWLATLSPAHVGGLLLVVRSLLVGGTLCAYGALDADELADALAGVSPGDDWGEELPPPTHCSLVPTQLLRLLDRRGGGAAPERLRCVLLGGAHAPAGLVTRALRAGWPIALTYGATEMSSQIATAPPDVVRAKPGTVGCPLSGVEIRLGEDGELFARGATRALDYVGADGAPLAADDGWYPSGDFGRIDADGDLWIVGRRSDRIVTGGVTVDAHEIEEALRTHPTVIDACVVGVPDEEWGERIGAWIEPVEGELELEEIERHLRATLSGSKLPRLWRVGPGLPRNPNGKADREAVRSALVDG